MLNSGQTKFCRLLERHMNGCNSSMYTRNSKKIASSLQAKRTKNLSQIAWVTARGQHRSSAKNYTKPVGVSPIYWRRFLDDRRQRGIELTHLHLENKIAPESLLARYFVISTEAEPRRTRHDSRSTSIRRSGLGFLRVRGFLALCFELSEL